MCAPFAYEWVSVWVCEYVCYICRIHFKCNSLLELRHKFEMRECEFSQRKYVRFDCKKNGATEMNIILYVKLLGIRYGVLHSNSLPNRNAQYLYCSRSLSLSLSLSSTHSYLVTSKCQPNAIICFSICHFKYFICKMREWVFVYSVACETTFRITLFSNNKNNSSNNTLQSHLFKKIKRTRYFGFSSFCRRSFFPCLSFLLSLVIQFMLIEIW